MEHTANNMEKNNGLISSLLKVFAIFGIRLSYEDKKMNIVSLNFINCKKETGSDSKPGSLGYMMK